MVNKGIIYGSKEQAVPLTIAKHFVYMRTDITKLETDFDGNPTDSLYQYNEIEYGKDEFIGLLFSQLALTQEALDYLIMEGE